MNTTKLTKGTMTLSRNETTKEANYAILCKHILITPQSQPENHMYKVQNYKHKDKKGVRIYSII